MKTGLVDRLIIGSMLLLLVAANGASAEGLKVYISADMEGIAGVVTDDQLDPGEFEYEQFRKFMTAEVNAAIAAAREVGAKVPGTI